jgi:predicted nucleotidyltransferase
MGDDKLHLWGISKRKELEIEGEHVWVASPEYVIVRKLEYFREGGSEKHLKDIASILAVSPDQIDFDQLREKISAYGLEKEWGEAQSVSEKQ